MSLDVLVLVQPVALDFAGALARRRYDKAYALTTQHYRDHTSLTTMQRSFERIIPPDWGPVITVALDEVLESWPEKQPDDLGWIYISLEGDHVYSEGLFVCVTRETGVLRVGDVTFGR